MSDANLFWGGDLNPNSIGDISLATDGALGQQRLLRRLLTNPGDYLWQPKYGAGLGQFVGKPCDAQSAKSVIRSQMFQEAIVARLPEPRIDVQISRDGRVYVTIQYAESVTGASQTLSFSVGP